MLTFTPVASKSIVLLKNKNNILPLSKNIRSLFLTGPNAANIDVLLGNYHGLSPNMVTPLEGIMAKINHGVKVLIGFSLVSVIFSMMTSRQKTVEVI